MKKIFRKSLDFTTYLLVIATSIGAIISPFIGHWAKIELLEVVLTLLATLSITLSLELIHQKISNPLKGIGTNIDSVLKKN